MITMHSVSAAYVKARQAEEAQPAPTPINPAPAPHCLERWSDSVAGADDMAHYADPELTIGQEICEAIRGAK